MGGVRLIFVGGVPRSGTTLLQNILDCHPEIIGGPEFDRIPDIIALRKKLHQSVASGRIDIICSCRSVDSAICSLMENLLLPFADQHGSRFVSEKTPWNILVSHELMQVCPEARFIHIVRDPRAVVASMLKVGKQAKRQGKPSVSFTRNTFAAIRCVQQCLEAGFSAGKYYPGRMLLVKYETLVRDPVATTQSICDFLKIEWDPGMVHPREKKHSGDKTLDGIWYDQNMYYRDPETSGIDKWKQELSNMQKALIVAAFETNMDLKRMEYVFGRDDLPKIYYLLSSISQAMFRGVENIFTTLVKRLKKISLIVKFYRKMIEASER